MESNGEFSQSVIGSFVDKTELVTNNEFQLFNHYGPQRSISVFADETLVGKSDKGSFLNSRKTSSVKDGN